RYRRGTLIKLTPTEKIAILAKLAEKHVSRDKFRKCLADVALKYGDIMPYREIIANGRSNGLNSREITILLSNAALTALPTSEKNETLSALAEREMAENKLNDELSKATPEIPSTEKQIDKILTAAANEALFDIVKKDYLGILGYKANKIIKLGMAVFGNGCKIKSIFGENKKS
ncbi:MAG: hypothetical protein LBF41_02230, partial [Deltaproteobacteria bacterium]|nr:hypothetical protein [Deltaproteobacteria bacterium]